MKPLISPARMKCRIKKFLRINASVEVMIFNVRIISHLPDKKGTIYYIYLF